MKALSIQQQAIIDTITKCGFVVVSSVQTRKLKNCDALREMGLLISVDTEQVSDEDQSVCFKMNEGVSNEQ